MSFGCVVLPRDLLYAILIGNESSGQFSGFYSDTEDLSVIVGLQHRGGAVQTKHSVLVNHRASSGFKERLMFWVKVRKGFATAFREGKIRDLADLKSWYHRAKGTPEFRKVAMVLFVEPDATACCTLIFALDSKPFSIHRVLLQILDLPLDIANLNDGLLPMELLAKKHVVVVGVGSGGSQMVLDVAAAGVGRVTLFDPDRLEPSNLFRHNCDVTDVGRFKVNALADRVYSHGLKTQVTPHRLDITDQAPAFYDVVGDCDLVICATDTRQSRALVNFAAVSLAKPMLAVCTQESATVGEIVAYWPGNACLECVRRTLRNVGAMVKESSLLETDSGSPYGGGSVDKPHTRGTKVDVHLVAGLAARIAVGLLTEGPAYLPHNYILWGSTPDTGRPHPFDFHLPLMTKYVGISHDPDCPVCGDYWHDPDDEGEKLAEAVCSG